MQVMFLGMPVWAWLLFVLALVCAIFVYRWTITEDYIMDIENSPEELLLENVVEDTNDFDRSVDIGDEVAVDSTIGDNWTVLNMTNHATPRFKIQNNRTEEIRTLGRNRITVVGRVHLANR